mgnify:FL=1
MKTATIFLSITIFMGVALAFLMNNNLDVTSGNNVSMEDGKQIVEVMAKGGYLPRISLAKADTPTILKVNTKGTFDCSASLTIPRLNYYALLPPSDVTEIEIPPQKAGTTIQGLCSMGMYSFQIKFS